MSISTAISQLETLVSKTRLLAEDIRCIKPCQQREQYESLRELKEQFHGAAAKLGSAIELLEYETAERVRNESGKFLEQAEKARAYIVENNQPKSLSAFRKSLNLIFEGPKDSAIDSGSVKSRNRQTRQRCEIIRELNCDGILSWAAGMPPSAWASGNMHNHTFDYLVESIEPEETQIWPSKMKDVLRIIGTEEPLSRCEKYREFLTAFDGPSETPRKRRRIEHTPPLTRSQGGVLADQIQDQGWNNMTYDRTATDAAPPQHQPPHERVKLPTHSLPPSKENREMKYMYTNAPAHSISQFPEPFRTAIQNSRQWKWERSQGLQTTGCFANLFPKDVAQDSSFTIWCGHNDGYRINETLGMQLVMSS